jgi:hypothetical protein
MCRGYNILGNNALDTDAWITGSSPVMTKEEVSVVISAYSFPGEVIDGYRLVVPEGITVT